MDSISSENVKSKKIVGIIPARYASSRFPGKPLVDIHGKPMIIRVYERAILAKKLADVIVATDDQRIAEVCKNNGIKTIMTRDDISFMTERVYAASLQVEADAYYCIPGDEPLISPVSIDSVVGCFFDKPTYDVIHAVKDIVDATEVIDYTNLKTAARKNGECVYISRSPIPYPKGSLAYQYCKLACGGVFSKTGLDFFHKTEKGPLESAEDCDIVRFVEYGRKVLLVHVDDKSVSVDTLKDLEHVRKLFKMEEL